MELTEYQKLQIISAILVLQEFTNTEGLNVEYVTEQQLLDIKSLFEKYTGTQTVEQIQSLTEIVSLLHQSLMEG